MKTYSIIYRTGGTDNFKWHRVGERYTTPTLAYAKQSELEKMGYPSLVHDTEMIESIGLPDTYQYPS